MSEVISGNSAPDSSTAVVKPSGLLKPTLNTRFRIDYGWWERSGEDLRNYLLSHLSPDQRERLAERGEESTVDYIDPETGEVRQLDALNIALQNAAHDPTFINPQTSVVDSVFRVFLSNGNQPQTPTELAERIGRPASVILKTFGGTRTYMGIRPTA